MGTRAAPRQQRSPPKDVTTMPASSEASPAGTGEAARLVDLRGESSARPPLAMRDAMRDAEPAGYGGGDAAVAELESSVAAMLGKESALFMPTVTMANLVILMHACRPGEEVIVDQDAHVYGNEAGGMSRIAGVMPRAVPRNGAMPDHDAVARSLDGPGVHAAPIRLVWTENTHNVGGGAVGAPDEYRRLAGLARQHGARVALDGARIFNAAEYLGLPVRDLVLDADFVALTFTKALSAPVGAMLVGDDEFITNARQLRLVLGGNIKKAGPLAAACQVALRDVLPGLAGDRQLATAIASVVAGAEGLRLDAPVVTNLIRVDTSEVAPARACVAALAATGVLAIAAGPTVIRLATHSGVSASDLPQIREALTALHRTAQAMAAVPAGGR
jgi:threonine aldolase